MRKFGRKENFTYLCFQKSRNGRSVRYDNLFSQQQILTSSGGEEAHQPPVAAFFLSFPEPCFFVAVRLHRRVVSCAGAFCAKRSDALCERIGQRDEGGMKAFRSRRSIRVRSQSGDRRKSGTVGDESPDIIKKRGEPLLFGPPQPQGAKTTCASIHLQSHFGIFCVSLVVCWLTAAGRGVSGHRENWLLSRHS